MHFTQCMLNPTTARLERYMDLLAAREKTTASNIANADTPGYKTKDIDFATELSAASGSLTPRTSDVQGLAVKTDGNNVSMDREAQSLSETGIRFHIATQFMQTEIRLSRDAMQDVR